MGKLRVDIKIPSLFLNIEKLQDDVLRLVGLFSEKEIVTMAQALHPAATPKEIIKILQPEYKKSVLSCEVTLQPAVLSPHMIIQGGRGAGKTMAVRDAIERVMEAKPKLSGGSSKIEVAGFYKDNLKYDDGHYLTQGGIRTGKTMAVKDNKFGEDEVWSSKNCPAETELMVKHMERDMEAKPKMDYEQLFKDISHMVMSSAIIEKAVLDLCEHLPITKHKAEGYIRFFNQFYRKFVIAYNEDRSIYTLAEMFFRPEFRHMIQRTCLGRNPERDSVAVVDVDKYKEIRTS